MKIQDYVAQTSGSFVLPDACFKVRALMDDESATIEDFASVIRVDPSLASRLLKLANSAIYNFPGDISTISRAVTIIGTQSIYKMMLIDITASAFKHFSSDNIDLTRFWHMSVFCGLVAKNLSVLAGSRDIERLFIAGLLQNFGELIVAKHSPKAAKKCEKFDGNMLPWDLQRQELGFSYTALSAELLKDWQLPEKIILPIRHYHQALNIDINPDIKILYLANRLALVDSFPEQFGGSINDIEKVAHAAGLSELDIENSVNFAKEEAQSILQLMGGQCNQHNAK